MQWVVAAAVVLLCTGGQAANIKPPEGSAFSEIFSTFGSNINNFGSNIISLLSKSFPTQKPAVVRRPVPAAQQLQPAPHLVSHGFHPQTGEQVRN